MIVSAAISNAQIRPDAVPPMNQDEVYWNAEYANLLNLQNAKLDSRRNALIVSLAGAGLTYIGGIVGVYTATESYDGTLQMGLPGMAMMGVGIVSIGVGGIWLLVNEFNMIKTQKRINEHLMLKYGPTGVALTF